MTITDSILRWRPDEFGNADRALYIGRIYVGHVHSFNHPRRPGTPWRAWIMTTDDGTEVGWFVSEAAAKAALFQAVSEAING